ncbi:MAG: 50S ribosomal protein L11 methyltransferase [Bilifractor sp.]
MKWKKYRLKTIEDAEDIIIATLYDCGIEGAEIEDKKPLTAEEKEQMFVDILPDMPDDDGVAYLDFYVDPEKEDTETVLNSVQKALEELRSSMDIGEGTIEESETEDKDWINNWKKYFRQFYVDDILITPSWEKVSEKDKDKMVLHIDPGTAFGTGMHETTQLCIRQLRKYVKPGTEMLDVGTGSGILAIVAVKLGAGHVLGTDLDPCAVPAVGDNKKANAIPEKAFDLLIGNMIGDKEVQDKAGYEKYDIVTANILADILVPMTPAVVPAMKKGGIYITSGILEDQAWKVLDACRRAGLEIVEQTQQGEWVSVTARKPE